jgi:hypothetical protein
LGHSSAVVAMTPATTARGMLWWLRCPVLRAVRT